MKRVYLFSFLTLLVFLGCKKSTPDYRECYVGTYKFEYQEVVIIPSSPPTHDTTIVSYTGTIEMTDSIGLNIAWHNGAIRMFEVNTAGSLVRCYEVPAGFINSTNVDLNYNESDCPNTPNTLLEVKLTGVKQ